jgi:hypothetical protein
MTATKNTELTRQSVSSPIGEVKRRLAEEEEHIDRAIGTGFAAMIEVVRRLATIRDQGLYRDDCDLFEDYLIVFERRTGISPKYVYRLMDAAETIRKLDQGFRLRKMLPDDTSVVGTFVQNEWQARQLKPQIAAVFNAADRKKEIGSAIQKGLANAKKELQQKERQRREQKELTSRAAVDSNGQPIAQEQDHGVADTDDDGFIRLTNGSGKVKYGTPRPDGHLLIGTEKGGKRLATDQDDGPLTWMSPLHEQQLKEIVELPPQIAKAVLRTQEAAILRILGYELDQEDDRESG